MGLLMLHAQQEVVNQDQGKASSRLEILSMPSASAQKLELLQELRSSGDPDEQMVAALSAWLLEPDRVSDLERSLALDILSNWNRLPEGLGRFLEEPGLYPGYTRQLLQTLASKPGLDPGRIQSSLFGLVTHPEATLDLRLMGMRLISGQSVKPDPEVEGFMADILVAPSHPLSLRGEALSYLQGDPVSIQAMIETARSLFLTHQADDSVSARLLQEIVFLSPGNSSASACLFDILLGEDVLDRNRQLARSTFINGVTLSDQQVQRCLSVFEDHGLSEERRLFLGPVLESMQPFSKDTAGRLFRLFQKADEAEAVHQWISEHLDPRSLPSSVSGDTVLSLVMDSSRPDFVRATALRWLLIVDDRALPGEEQLIEWIENVGQGTLLAGAASVALKEKLRQSIAMPRVMQRSELNLEIQRLQTWRAILSDIDEVDLTDPIEWIGRKLKVLQQEQEGRLSDRFWNWWNEERPASHPAFIVFVLLLVCFTGCHFWWRSLALNDPAGILSLRRKWVEAGPLPPSLAGFLTRILMIDYWSRRPEVLAFVVQTCNRHIKDTYKVYSTSDLLPQPLKIDGRDVWWQGESSHELISDNPSPVVILKGDEGSGKSSILHAWAVSTVSEAPPSESKLNEAIPLILDKASVPAASEDGVDLISRRLHHLTANKLPWLSRSLVAQLIEQGQFQFYLDDADFMPAWFIKGMGELLSQYDCSCYLAARQSVEMPLGTRPSHSVVCLGLNEREAIRALRVSFSKNGKDLPDAIQYVIRQCYKFRAGLPMSATILSILKSVLMNHQQVESRLEEWGRVGVPSLLHDFLSMQVDSKRAKKEVVTGSEDVAVWMVEHPKAMEDVSNSEFRGAKSKPWNRVESVWTASGWLREGNRIAKTEPVRILAAFKWVREHGDDETFWKSFFQKLDKSATSFRRGGIRNLAEVWMALGSRDEEMLWVEDRLLDAMEEGSVEQISFRKAFKLTRSLHELFAMDTMERKRIIEHLKSLGPDLHDAVPELVRVLLDHGGEVESRQSALLILDSCIEALKSSEQGLEGMLVDTDEYLFLREEMLPWFKGKDLPFTEGERDGAISNGPGLEPFWQHCVKSQR